MIIVGLGNPKEEYKETRHNVGEMAVSYLREAWNFPEWEKDGRLDALVSKGKLPKLGEVLLLLPQMYMNNSGKTLKSLITSKKKAENLVVIHDDLDIPFGKVKISFNKSAGGHRGVQNIVNQIKTESFVRIRIGISGETKKGIKKPEGEKKVLDFILGKFKPDELKALKKEFKKIEVAVKIIIEEGWSKAASVYPSL